MSSPQVAVADSWLSVDGRVLDLTAHADRFARDCERVAGVGNEARRRLFELAAATPAIGRWFPRLDCQFDGGAATPAFRIHQRVAPAPTGPVMLWTAGHDPRTQPWVKGPDLEVGAHLRAEASRRLPGGSAAAPEAVILSRGQVCDGALSALVWWRDQTLCLPDLELPRVGSVTAAWLHRRAVAAGISVRTEAVTPAELAGVELWALSALHGVRPVVGWVNGPELVVNLDRAEHWQALLASDRTS